MELTLHISPPLLRKNEQGFVVAGALLVVTLTLVSLIFIFFFENATFTNLKLKSSCKSLSFSHEANMKRLLEKLLSLNSRALSLRHQYEAAQKRLAHAMMSGTPPAIAAAEAHVLFIETERLAHASKQNLILARAKSESQFFKIRMRTEMSRHFSAGHDLQVIATGLAVDADVPLDVAPQYFTRSNFIFEQRSGAIWKAPFQSYLPFSKFLSRQTLVTLPFAKRWENACAASLEERRPREFFVTMTTAKSWSRF